MSYSSDNALMCAIVSCIARCRTVGLKRLAWGLGSWFDDQSTTVTVICMLDVPSTAIMQTPTGSLRTIVSAQCVITCVPRLTSVPADPVEDLIRQARY